MRTHFKTLVFAIATIVAFLACSNSPDSQTQPKCKQVGWASTVVPDNIPEECKGEDKKIFRISEMHWEETDWDYLGGATSGGMTSGQYNSSTGEISGGDKYTLNGEEVSEEEYLAYMEEYWAKYQEQQKGKRNLEIPCVITDDAVTWTALLTEKEAAALLKEYGELHIELERDVYNAGGAVADGGVNESCL